MVSLAFRRKLYGAATRVAGCDFYANLPSDPATVARLQRVTAAFDLIEEFWPVRYARLRSFAPRFVVTEVPRRVLGAYVTRENTIILQAAFVDQWQPESIAMVVCHELLHAFIDSRGVRGGPWMETRSELLADLEMRLWAARLLNAGAMPQQVARELKTIIERSRMRMWWHRDGRRSSGSRVFGEGKAGAGNA